MYFVTECTSESRLHINPGVANVTVDDSPIDYSYLFNFDDTDKYYCAPTNMRPFSITISYSTQVLLTEIGIHGRDRNIFLSDEYVTSFSLSYFKDDNFTEYIRDTGSPVRCYITLIHMFLLVVSLVVYCVR